MSITKPLTFALVLLAAGCAQGSNPDFTGGAGGTSTSSATTTGSGGHGAGGDDGCASPADCPGMDGDCQQRTCEGGKCGLVLVAADTAVATQTAKDCKVLVCDGAGMVVTANDDDDLPDDGNPCTEDICAGGMPSHEPVAAGTTCGTDLVCDGKGACVGCVTGDDCPGTDGACRTRACTAGACGFSYTPAGTAAGTQTAGDCHRNECDGAGNIVSKNDDTDPPDDGKECTTDVCNAGVPKHVNRPAGTTCSQGGGTKCDGAGLCQTCTDGIKNGTETGVDCGGACPACMSTGCPGGIVISQIYGGGGNSGATFANDYVELHNGGGAAVSVAGWSVQYASASGSSWSAVALTGSIPAGGFYLVKLAAGGSGGASLPASDAMGSNNLSASTGKLALVSATASLSGTCPTSSNIVDLVGYGSGASCSEGAGPASGPSSGVNDVAILRAANGCTDANVNSTDFATGAPNPRNSASPVVLCACPP